MRGDDPEGRRRDRGATDAIGLVVVAGAMVGLALIVTALGRQVDSRAQMRSAAEAAAQAAALERTPEEARRAGRAVALAMLVDSDTCSRPEVVVNPPSVYDSAAGTSFGIVTVDVTCTVDNRGLEAVLDDQSATTVTGIASVDLFRAQAP